MAISDSSTTILSQIQICPLETPMILASLVNAVCKFFWQSVSFLGYRFFFKKQDIEKTKENQDPKNLHTT
jgi:hypothetical protein